MRIIFMGTSAFAVPSLEALAASEHELISVVTTPDKPAGRGRSLKPSPVKQMAQQLETDILQPATFEDEQTIAYIKEKSPDLFIVVSYGKILPQPILQIPRIGAVNIHASLLPKYRGADPIRAAILAGDCKTGVSTMWMSPGLDEGDVIFQQTCEISDNDTYGTLHENLSSIGADLMLKTLQTLETGETPRIPQDNALASYTSPLKKDDTQIDWSCSAEEISRLIRALNPFPVAFCFWRRKRLKVWAAEKNAKIEGIPGKIVELTKKGPLVACSQGGLCLIELQPEGKKRISEVTLYAGIIPQSEKCWSSRKILHRWNCRT